MTEQTVPFGGTAVATPPVGVLPPADDDTNDNENRGKLLLVLAAVGVLILACAGWFLMKSGGSSNPTASGAVPHGVAHKAATKPGAAKAAAGTVKLPRTVTAPLGRDPFKALYTAPVAAPAAAPGSTTSAPTGTVTSTTSNSSTSQSGSSGSTGSTGTSTSFHPVWVQLKSTTATTATFDVGYSNGKTLRAVRYSSVKAPAAGKQTVFASTFALLSIRNGEVTVRFGDGSPFRLDSTHNYMVVD